MTSSVFAPRSIPSSIPSPDYDWQSFNIGQWLRDLGWDWVGFNLTIHTYAVFIMVGIIAAAVIANRRLVRRGAEPWIVLDISIWAVLLGILGARIFHVLTHPDDYFYEGADLLRTLYIWEGGIAIFGALIGGAIGAYIGCRMTGIRFWSFVDAVAPGLLLAQAFGRFGNWFNHELFGLPTDLPWGLEIEPTNPAFPAGLPEDTLFHPTFAYEVLWNLLGVAVLFYLSRKAFYQWGKLFGVYLIWYGAGRAVWESIRIDPTELFLGVRVNVWVALLAVVIGVVIIVVQSRRHPGIEPSVYVPGREWEPERDIHSDDTYTEYDLNDDNDDAEAATVASVASGAGPSDSASSDPR